MNKERDLKAEFRDRKVERLIDRIPDAEYFERPDIKSEIMQHIQSNYISNQEVEEKFVSREELNKLDYEKIINDQLSLWGDGINSIDDDRKADLEAFALHVLIRAINELRKSKIH